MFFLGCLSLFTFLLDPFSEVWAETHSDQNELLAIGDVPVHKGNAANAKKAAVAQALMKGVEDYVVQLLGTERVARDFERVTEDIIPGLKEDIENFHILAEHQVKGRYKVFLRLRVNEEAIRERLRSAGALLVESSPVNVLFMVSESGDSPISYWWKDTEGDRTLSPVEIALHKVFQERGFNPVNRTLIPPGGAHVEGLPSPDLRDEDILKWGRIFSADVVIFGECETRGGKEISLTVKAIDVSQGIKLCQESVVEEIPATSNKNDSFAPVLDKMVNRLAASIIPCIKGSFGSDRGKNRSLTVTLTGMKMPNEFWRFNDFLKKEIVGITSVIPSRIKGDTMSATVEFQGDRSTFVNRVLSHPRQPFPMRLDPSQHEAIVFNLE